MHVVSRLDTEDAWLLTASTHDVISARCEKTPRAKAAKKAMETSFPTTEEMTFIMIRPMMIDPPESPRATFLRVSESIAANSEVIYTP